MAVTHNHPVNGSSASDGTPFRASFLNTPFDLIEGDGIVAILRRQPRISPFRYVVTPNVDHVVRLRGEKALALAYSSAWLSLCDSRPIVLLARVLGLKLPHLPGSDLTEVLFREVLRPGERIALIASSDPLVRAVEAAYTTLDFVSLVPPPQTGSSPAAMQACVKFVTESQAKFTFIAIGSPVSERIAFEVLQDGRANGTAFCVGAAFEFLVGHKQRAPRWVRFFGLEWMHRLISEPRRLWRRYI